MSLGDFTRAEVINSRLVPIGSGHLALSTLLVGPVELDGGPVPPPLPQPEPPPVIVAPFPRPMYVGVFDDKTGDAPANTAAIGPTYPLQWVDLEYAETHDLPLDTVWAAAVRPRWVYAPPAHRTSLVTYLSAGDEIWTPAYRDQGESLAAFEARLAEDLDFLATFFKHPLEIVCGAYDRGFLTEQECLECFPVYRRLCDVSPLIHGVRFFAYSRGNGVAKYPSFRPWLEAFAAASPGVPSVNIPVPPLPVPDHNGARKRRFYV